MYTLYGMHGSGSASAEIALRRCGAPYRVVEAAEWDRGPGYEELGRYNPLRQIPTLLLPDGSVLTESAAIQVHLGLTHPDSGLLPHAASARAQSIRGLVYIAANCYSQITIIDYPERYTTATDKPAREAVAAAAKQRLHLHWQLFADQFAAYPYLAGDRLGGLDILAAVVSRWSGARAFLAKERPEFHATLERIERDPQVAEVFGQHWPKTWAGRWPRASRSCARPAAG